MEKIIAKESVFGMKKIHMKTLKLQLLDPYNYINYEQFAFCPMKIHHAVPEKGYDKLFFLKML